MTVTSVAEHIDLFRERFVRITREVGKRIVGNEEIVESTVTALLAGGTSCWKAFRASARPVWSTRCPTCCI
jgi:hypothetical protein